MFSRGDTNYINQRGEVLAKGRCSAIRYRAENARAMASSTEQSKAPEWTIEDLDNLEAQSFQYYKTFQNHLSRNFNDVKKGEELPVRPDRHPYCPDLCDRVALLYVHRLERRGTRRPAKFLPGGGLVARDVA